MNDILIVGAGGFGREVYTYVEDCICAGMPWRIRGFVDDDPHALDPYDYPHGIVGGVDDCEIGEGDLFIAAIGIPRAKRDIVGRLAGRGAKFAALVHPTARVGRNVSVGMGCILCPHVFTTCDIKIGDFVVINCKSGLGHDVEVGSWTTISSFCDITGRARLGEGVFMGSSSVAMPGSSIGDWAVVGANSGVVSRVRAASTVYGNPAARM